MRKLRAAHRVATLVAYMKLVFVFSALLLVGGLRKIEITQTDTATWSASSAGISTDIERLGMITRIACTNEIVPASSMDGDNAADAIWRTVQNMRLEGGGFTYFTLPGDAGGQGGTLWHYYNQKNMGVSGAAEGSDISAPNRTYVPATWWWHPGSFPVVNNVQNEFDLSALIPALHDSSLRAIWVTTVTGVMDANFNTTSAVMRFTLYYVIGTDSEVKREMAKQFAWNGYPQGVPRFDRGVPSAMVPNWGSLTIAGDATYTDYQFEQNIPTGGYLRQLWILSQDDTATRPVRASDEVSAVKIILPGQENPIQAYNDHWIASLPYGALLKVNDAEHDWGNASPAGITMKDFRGHGNPIYGLNLEHVSSGSAKIGATINAYVAGDDYLYLFDKLHPYYGLLGFPG